jgi:hypothetical protein
VKNKAYMKQISVERKKKEVAREEKRKEKSQDRRA